MLFPDHFDHDWRAGSRDRVYDADRVAAARRHRGARAAGDRHARGARASPTSAEAWIDDLELVTDGPKLRELLDDCGATLIGYRALRDAMRRAG